MVLLMTEPQTFGEWLKATRESKRYSVVDCARRVGMNHAQWSRLEADEPKRSDGSAPQPTRKTVEKVALALDVPVTKALRAAGYSADLLPTRVSLENGSAIVTDANGENRIPTAAEVEAAMSVLQRMLRAMERSQNPVESPEGESPADEE